MSESEGVSASPEELVRALKQGDRAAFATVYELYADRIYSYCLSICRNEEWAADAMQDAFMLAFARAAQLRDASKLRSWLYAIARNECLRQLRVHRREANLEVAGEVVDVNVTTDSDLDAADARSLIDAAFMAMNTNDRDVLDLALRQDLDTSSIASVLKVSENNASAKVSRAKSQLETVVGALLLFRSRGADCPKLKESMGAETEFNVLSRKRIARHAQECPSCSRTKKRAIAAIAMAGLPILVAPTSIREFLVGSSATDVGSTTASDYTDLSIDKSSSAHSSGDAGDSAGSIDDSGSASQTGQSGANDGQIGDGPGNASPSYISTPSAGYVPASMVDRAAQLDKSRPKFDKDGWPTTPTKQKPKAILAVAGVALVALMGSAFVLAIGNDNQPEQSPAAASSEFAPAPQTTSAAGAAKGAADKLKVAPTPTTPKPTTSVDDGANAGDEAAGPNAGLKPKPKPKPSKPQPKPTHAPRPPSPTHSPTPAPTPTPTPTPGGPGGHPGGPGGIAPAPGPIPG